jgi:hypothetical protein
MALRAGFASASFLGVVTTFGTTLWVVAVSTLGLFVLGLALVEAVPRLRHGSRS